MAATLSPRTRRASGPGPSARDPRRVLRLGAPRPGGTLLVALLLVLLYAAFADGGVGLPEASWLQAAIAVLALGAAGVWLYDQGLVLSAPRRVWVGIGLLVAFALWAAVTLSWSVAPDRSWGELNRALSYALFAVLAVGVASSLPRAAERLAIGWLGVAVAVALYALGGKVAPGVNVPGLLDLNDTSEFSRLREPLGYWNALGLVCALGAPVAVRLAVDEQRRRLVRLGALAALWVLVLALAMTYSRGGLLALGVGVALTTWLASRRLRGLLVLAVAGLATVPAVSVAFLDPALAQAGADLGSRIVAGGRLALVMAVCLAALLAGGWALLRLEGRVRWSPRRSARVWRAAAVTAAVVAVLALVGAAVSDRGLGGTAQALADSFTGDDAAEVSDPGRLATVNSANRWGWWQEAVGAWSDRPVGGWGASSFPVVHRLYRDEPVNVAQPHNVPLQFLVETGVVGAALALGGIGVLLVAAFARVRAMARGRARDMSAALLAGASAWLAHGLLDWDWDIPAVTLPALAFLGVLCARGPEERGPARASSGNVAMRGAALAGVAAVLCLVIASALAPAWSQSLTEDALVGSGQDSSPEAKAEAAADAQLAARVNPVAVEPLLAGATVAISRERLVDAKALLVRAVRRQPSSVRAWRELARLSSVLTVDRDAYALAAEQVVALDPAAPESRLLVERAAPFVTPPALSATATGTPLTPGFVPAPGALPPEPAAPPAPGAPTP